MARLSKKRDDKIKRGVTKGGLLRDDSITYNFMEIYLKTQVKWKFCSDQKELKNKPYYNH